MRASDKKMRTMTAAPSSQGEAKIDRSVSLMLRGVAIIIVVFSHYTEWMYIPSPFPRFTHWISTIGPAGVDIFFALSGYGLYMSAVSGSTEYKLDPLFLLKRLLNVYIPYLLIASAINILMGGSMFRDITVLCNVLTGGDYWYIRILLVFYLFFSLAFMLCGKFRLAALTIMVTAYTVWLHKSGYRDFWTLSNLSFLAGVYIAAFSKRYSGKWAKRSFRLTTGSVFFVLFLTAYLLMGARGGSGMPHTYKYEFAANLCFPVAVLSFATFIGKWKGVLLKLPGESSLFQYLLHTILFCNIITLFEGRGYVFTILMAALITMIAAYIPYKLYSLLINRLGKSRAGRAGAESTERRREK